MQVIPSGQIWENIHVLYKVPPGGSTGRTGRKLIHLLTKCSVFKPGVEDGHNNVKRVPSRHALKIGTHLEW
jgi:hypothetical protein